MTADPGAAARAPHVVHATLEAWGNFYLITGTAAATLTGLQFIVQTLLASDARPLGGGDPEGGIAAFGSPTVVHLSLALLLSAVLSAPWVGYVALRVTLGLLGAGALVYSGVVLRRARRQHGYTPATEDWVWHVSLPAAAYAAVLVAGVILDGGGLLLVAAATLLLIFIGIHNAWDTITYLTVNALRDGAREGGRAPARAEDPAT